MNSISTTANNDGYIMTGSASDKIWVIKINNTGDMLWSGTYDIGVNEFGSDIRETPDNSFILTGGVKFGASANPYNVFLLEIGTSTAVEDRQVYSPQKFYLYPNYPNPFNPATNFRFRNSGLSGYRFTM